MWTGVAVSWCQGPGGVQFTARLRACMILFWFTPQTSWKIPLQQLFLKMLPRHPQKFYTREEVAWLAVAVGICQTVVDMRHRCDKSSKLNRLWSAHQFLIAIVCNMIVWQRILNIGLPLFYKTFLMAAEWCDPSPAASSDCSSGDTPEFDLATRRRQWAVELSRDFAKFHSARRRHLVVTLLEAPTSAFTLEMY